MKDGTPFYWFRLTEAQCNILLKSNAEKLIDPDIKRRYNLQIVAECGNVYATEYKEKITNHKDGSKTSRMVEDKSKRKLLARVIALSTFYKNKGAGYFDKDYEG